MIVKGHWYDVTLMVWMFIFVYFVQFNWMYIYICNCLNVLVSAWLMRIIFVDHGSRVKRFDFDHYLFWKKKESFSNLLVILIPLHASRGQYVRFCIIKSKKAWVLCYILFSCVTYLYYLTCFQKYFNTETFTI